MNLKCRIRPLKQVSEYHNCEAIQKSVWKFADREIIPVNELITIRKSGGIVLGAFSRNDKMLGFVFGFPGIRNGKMIHCSRMLAVLHRYRNSDIGYKLKLAQRRLALKQGIKLITWTFDPLQSLNAYFNINKLGVIIREYYANLYGTSSSILNRGLETDRFLAEWWITKELKGLRVKKFKGLLDKNLIINPTHYNKSGWISCGKPRLNLNDKHLFVEIPPNIMALKKTTTVLARDWRAKTRKIFTTYLNRSYIINGFISEKKNGSRRSYYILSRDRNLCLS